MGKAEKDFAELLITPLAGSSFSNFKKVTAGRAVAPKYRKRYRLSKLVSLAMEPLRWWEELRWNSRIGAYEMPEPPVFIIGHWRSGTTFLHNLLAQDPQFGYCTTYQTTFPHLLLSHQWWFRPILKKMMPERRPSDGVLLGIDLPQEDDIGLGNTIPNTIYNTFFFPNDIKEFVQKNISRTSETKADEELFMQGYQKFAAKAMLNPIFKKRTVAVQRLLSKNPPHTARIDLLLRLFPGAKFIYLHRDPYDTIASFRKFALGVFPGLQLQHLDMACYEDALIDLYMALLEKYDSTKYLIPKGDLIEVAYKGLIEEPLLTVANIYSQLGIKGFAKSQTAMEQFISEQKNHKVSGYGHEKEFMRTVDTALRQ